jgi:hypothetical protein
VIGVGAVVAHGREPSCKTAFERVALANRELRDKTSGHIGPCQQHAASRPASGCSQSQLTRSSIGTVPSLDESQLDKAADQLDS